ncbi:cytochrome c biogenesis CcdA family protein [Rhodococcus antarcticus]|uniref:Cytochrome c biogenesis CcdA family protein n=1 Tax=Rhodococcus antarcticus TaxID=2987751 RepID=A0ABY6P0J3_9NOCA|nr:cytochrome c biogenesis CcdA family protein [Rhodococcus antarcticus]UZJ25155.1 cytochrome c biogenesis CcdA family protein [Rhodococcus antarcticus]
MSVAGIAQTFQDTAATGPLLLAIVVSVLAGTVSFASPCVIPLVPGYLSYLAGLVGVEVPAARLATAGAAPAPQTPTPDTPGTAAADTATAEAVSVSQRRDSWRVAGAAGLFVGGFSVVFTLATVSLFGVIAVLRVNTEVLQRVGGVVTIVMGLAFLGLVPALQRDTRPAPRRRSSLLGAPVLGAVFGLGWTPCLGPTLAGVLSVAAGTEGATAWRGVTLVLAYCVGLGAPFVLLALGSTRAVHSVQWLRRNTRTIQLVGGVLLVVVGVALVTGYWGNMVSWMRSGPIANVVTPI